MKRKLIDRIEQVERSRLDIANRPPLYVSYSSDDWDAMSDDQRAMVKAGKIYIGFSPDDWDNEEETPPL